LFQEAQAALEASDFPTAKARLKAILDLYAATRVGAAAERMYAEVSVVGTTAPEVAVEKWYAGTGAWSDAPVTLVVFFETWCPHCQNEMPRAEAMYERWRPLGLGVVGFTRVTKSASDDTVRSFISEHHLTFPVGKEQAGTLSAAFSVSGIPAAAVVKDGVIVWRGHPARLTDNLLRQYLGA
jgi:peroxiredoxin